MSLFAKYLAPLFKAPLSVLLKSQIVPDNVIDDLEIDPSRPIFYVIKTNSFSDKFALARACKKLNMPSPHKTTTLASDEVDTLLCIENPKPLIFGQASDTRAIAIGNQILKAHLNHPDLDAQLVPVSICWGRAPGKDNQDVQSLIADAESPNWLRKLFIVLFSGRFNLVSYSKPVSIRTMVNKHSADDNAGNKLLRVARFHFYRRKVTATGPRLWTRSQMSNSVISAVAVKKAIEDQVSASGESTQQVRAQARKLIDEIASDYRENYVRVGSRFLKWLWNKLYSGIKVNNAEVVRELAQLGHEIIYVPCHRSHIDYLLLSYVIYDQGLVPPHIAAGINLNFGPVGPVLRRGGAFYLRRSFKGNRLYGAIFSEYLSQLFAKGYSVEYFTEGGRSRTGRLLNPKTGMLAMTIQASLRGIDRPISFVPVYMGYEHVMEVNTYLKELKGSSKKSESMLGIFKAIRQLRDYGYGYVNFGQPLQLNEFLNQHVPDWKNDICHEAPPKPQWLTPTCNKLAKQIMTRINNATALNPTTLIALSLLATDKHAMSRQELETQLNLYLNLQSQSQYSPSITLPDMNATQMVSHVITLQKVEVSNDTFGQVVSLNEKESVLMTYYQNNVIHLFAIPSFIAAHVLVHGPQTASQIIAATSHLFVLFKDEWFLRDLDIASYCESIIAALIEQNLFDIVDNYISCAHQHSSAHYQLELLANIVQNTLQRYAIVMNLIVYSDNINKEDLEQKSLAIASRLSAKHGITSPEFTDSKVLGDFINSLLRHQLCHSNDVNQFESTQRLEMLNQTVTSVLDNRVMQSITQVLQPD